MDCNTCKHRYIENDFIYCKIDVPNDVFELDCEHAECPYYDGDDNA